jgi:hypothetical protein
MKKVIFDLEYSQLVSNNSIYLGNERYELLILLKYAKRNLQLLQKRSYIFIVIPICILTSTVHQPLPNSDLHLLVIAKLYMNLHYKCLMIPIRLSLDNLQQNFTLLRNLIDQ